MLHIYCEVKDLEFQVLHRLSSGEIFFTQLIMRGELNAETSYIWKTHSRMIYVKI